MKKVLVVSPHVDDAEIGLGGTIPKMIAQGFEVHVMVIVTKDDNLYNHEGIVSGSLREEEFDKSMERLGVMEYSVMYSSQHLQFDLCCVPKTMTVSKLDDYLIAHKIDWLFMPTPSFHQEHQYCYECCVASSRPTHTKVKLSRVYAYEYPGSIWSASGSPDTLGGRWYFDISTTFEEKKKVLEVHLSQHLDRRQLISIGSVESLAKLRGYESGFEYAEMAYLMRGFD